MDGNLAQLQNVVGKYVDQYNLLVAAGPLGAATAARLFVNDNKILKLGMVGGGVWFAITEISGPLLGLIQDNFGQLQTIFSLFQG